ncbi:dynamin family protein [Geodermatophilus sp. URMC 64]
MSAPTGLLDRAQELAAACGRPDLEHRLAQVRQRLARPGVRVLVAGEAGQGKSTLVNALVGAPVCGVAGEGVPIGRSGVTTTVPTAVRGGPAPAAALVLGRPDGDGADLLDDAALERTAVPVETLVAQVARAAESAGGRLVQAEAQLPRQWLSGGLEIVDTPGVGSVNAALTMRTVGLLPGAHAVVVVSDASQEFTAPELAFIGQAAALCEHVVVALTKTDLHPHWRQVADLDRGHLARAGIEAPVLPVSAVLEIMAVAQRDAELREESGVGVLREHLRGEVGDAAAARARSSVARDVASVAEQLALATRAELAALQDPASLAETARELEAVRGRLEDLNRRSARWQQMLSDGVTDLMADIDFDLRDRSRVIGREAEETIEANDPGPMWDEIANWLEERVAGAVTDSFVWATQRSEWLAARVVEQFAADRAAVVPELAIGEAGQVLDSLVELAALDSGATTVRERLLVGMRGSYSGVLMTGLVTSLAGMPLLNPVSVVAGLVLGRKAYKDDAAARRQRRQNEANSIVRRHLDEVVFQAGKHLKDRLRAVQRTLRDLIAETVTELSRTLAEAQRAAQQATRTAAVEREARLRELRRRLEQLDRLTAEVRRLPGTAAVR